MFFRSNSSSFTVLCALPLAVMAALPDASAADGTVTPSVTAAHVVGADACRTCHQSEHDAWSKSTHFRNHERISSAAGKAYIQAYGSDTACVNCHSTPHDAATAKFTGDVGVSCESCHTAAGGDNGWFKIHSDYGGKDVKREDESDAHRTERLKKCDSAGMIRAASVHQLAKNCYSCHIVADEKLLAAGHKPGQSAFDLIPWLQGEVRHNFQVDQKVNAESPSLLQARQGITTADRKRVMLVVAKLVELEVCLTNLANMDSDNLKQGYAGSKGWAGRAEDALEFLAEDVLDVVDDEHVTAAVEAAEEVKLGRRFKDQAGAKEAAAAVAKATKSFVDAHPADTSGLKDLDEFVEDLAKPKGEVYTP